VGVIFLIDISQRFNELGTNLQGVSHLLTKHLRRLQGMSESFGRGNWTCDLTTYSGSEPQADLHRLPNTTSVEGLHRVLLTHRTLWSRAKKFYISGSFI